MKNNIWIYIRLVGNNIYALVGYASLLVALLMPFTPGFNYASLILVALALLVAVIFLMVSSAGVGSYRAYRKAMERLIATNGTAVIKEREGQEYFCANVGYQMAVKDAIKMGIIKPKLN